MIEYFEADPEDTEIEWADGEVNFYMFDLESNEETHSIFLTLSFEQIIGLAEQIKAGLS